MSEPFFDRHDRFYKTSETRPARNRFNARHTALIAAQRPIIEGKKILDLASHDGRWSFAALKAGAVYVEGVEGRAQLVEKSIQNFQFYGINKSHYRFYSADIRQYLRAAKPGRFNTIFCLGFLYHTLYHMDILVEIARLAPRHILIDTVVSTDSRPVIEIVREDPRDSRNTIDYIGAGTAEVPVGLPSVPALELMLSAVGYEMNLYDWHATNSDWTDIEDYLGRCRVTAVAAPNGSRKRNTIGALPRQRSDSC